METTTTETKTTIVYRTKPCRCGCKGSDSWHARSFIRTVREIRPASGKAETCNGAVDVVYEGVARFPWGAARVVRFNVVSAQWDDAAQDLVNVQVTYSDGSPYVSQWFVDRG